MKEGPIPGLGVAVPMTDIDNSSAAFSLTDSTSLRACFSSAIIVAACFFSSRLV